MIYEQVMKIQAVAYPISIIVLAVYRSRSHEKERCSRCMNMSCEHVCTGTHTTVLRVLHFCDSRLPLRVQ